MTGSRIGVALLLAFVASQAVRDVYLGSLFGDFSLFEMAFMAFASAALVFGAGLLLFERRQLKLLAENWRGVIALNVTTAIAWISYFGSLRLVEPAAANLAFCGVAPIAVMLLAAMGLRSREKRTSSVERMLHYALFGTVLLLGFVVATGGSGTPELSALVGLGGVALGALAGVAITAETVFAKRMNDGGVAALPIVGVRFLLVTAIAAAGLLGTGSAYVGMSSADVLVQAAIFLVILIGPIYLAQAGLQRSTPLISGAVLALGPLGTLFLQAQVGTVPLSPAMTAVVSLYAVTAIAAAWIAAAPGLQGKEGTPTNNGAAAVN